MFGTGLRVAGGSGRTIAALLGRYPDAAGAASSRRSPVRPSADAGQVGELRPGHRQGRAPLSGAATHCGGPTPLHPPAPPAIGTCPGTTRRRGRLRPGRTGGRDCSTVFQAAARRRGAGLRCRARTCRLPPAESAATSAAAGHRARLAGRAVRPAAPPQSVHRLAPASRLSGSWIPIPPPTIPRIRLGSSAPTGWRCEVPLSGTMDRHHRFAAARTVVDGGSR